MIQGGCEANSRIVINCFVKYLTRAYDITLKAVDSFGLTRRERNDMFVDVTFLQNTIDIEDRLFPLMIS